MLELAPLFWKRTAIACSVRDQRIDTLLTLNCHLPPQLAAAYRLHGPASDRPDGRACRDAFGVWVTY